MPADVDAINIAAPSAWCVDDSALTLFTPPAVLVAHIYKNAARGSIFRR